MTSIRPTTALATSTRNLRGGGTVVDLCDACDTVEVQWNKTVQLLPGGKAAIEALVLSPWPLRARCKPAALSTAASPSDGAIVHLELAASDVPPIGDLPDRLELELATMDGATTQWRSNAEAYIGRAPDSDALEVYTTAEYRALLEQAAFPRIEADQVADVKALVAAEAGGVPVVFAGATIAGPAQQGDPEDGI